MCSSAASQLAAILKSVDRKLRSGGRIVLNCITVQTLLGAIDYFRAQRTAYTYDAIQVQVNRLRQVGPYDMAQAQNPIFIVRAEKR